jgi:predicted amidohydrolase YtcJ
MDAGAARSIAELQDLVRSYATRRPGRPLVAMGLALEGLTERRWPTPVELDQAVRGQPVVVYHASGHVAVANSAALASLPARPATDGAGVVQEEELRSLRPLLEQALPLTPGLLEETVRGLVRFGVTSVGAINTGPRELALLDELAAVGRLPLRVRAYPPATTAGTLDPMTASDERMAVAVVGAKAFLDGAFGPHTASLDEPYADAPSTRGVDRGDDRELARWVEGCGEAGLTPALHAIGDRAVGRAARLLSSPSAGVSSGRIEHGSLTPPSVLELLRRARPSVVVQPGFVVSDHWLRERLGAERARWAYAFRSLLDAGVPLAGSSDAPYDAPDPWRAMRAAVERQDRLGRSANPSPYEALPVPQALGLFTEGAHRALGLVSNGRLEPGSPADLVVLAAPNLAEAVRRGAAAVRATWTQGRPVFDALTEAGGRG